MKLTFTGRKMKFSSKGSSACKKLHSHQLVIHRKLRRICRKDMIDHFSAMEAIDLYHSKPVVTFRVYRSLPLSLESVNHRVSFNILVIYQIADKLQHHFVYWFPSNDGQFSWDGMQLFVKLCSRSFTLQISRDESVYAHVVRQNRRKNLKKIQWFSVSYI